MHPALTPAGQASTQFTYPGVMEDRVDLGRWLCIEMSQGSDTQVCTKKTRWFFWVHPPPENPHFYVNLILVYTLYATNNAIFYCFKAFKALSY